MSIKISVEDVDHNNYAFTCICFEPVLGDNTPNRVITEQELLDHLGADYLNRIPQVYNAGEENEQHDLISFQEWIDNTSALELHEVLADLINKQEGRTQPQPKNKSARIVDFMPAHLVDNINKILNG